MLPMNRGIYRNIKPLPYIFLPNVALNTSFEARTLGRLSPIDTMYPQSPRRDY